MDELQTYIKRLLHIPALGRSSSACETVPDVGEREVADRDSVNPPVSRSIEMLMCDPLDEDACEDDDGGSEVVEDSMATPFPAKLIANFKGECLSWSRGRDRNMGF